MYPLPPFCFLFGSTVFIDPLLSFCFGCRSKIDEDEFKLRRRFRWKIGSSSEKGRLWQILSIASEHFGRRLVVVDDGMPGHLARHPAPRRLVAFSAKLQRSREAGVTQPSSILRVGSHWSWVTPRFGSGQGPRLSGFLLVSTMDQSQLQFGLNGWWPILKGKTVVIYSDWVRIRPRSTSGSWFDTFWFRPG